MIRAEHKQKRLNRNGRWTLENSVEFAVDQFNESCVKWVKKEKED